MINAINHTAANKQKSDAIFSTKMVVLRRKAKPVPYRQKVKEDYEQEKSDEEFKLAEIRKRLHAREMKIMDEFSKAVQSDSKEPISTAEMELLDKLYTSLSLEEHLIGVALVSHKE